MARSAQDIAATWASRMAGSGDKWLDGVNSVTVAPGAAAARQKDAWANNTIAAKDKWATRVGAVSLADWQTAMKDKGQQRIASGAQAAQGKFADFMTQLMPKIDQVKGQLPPRGNLEQNIARMTAFTRGMAGFQYKK